MADVRQEVSNLDARVLTLEGTRDAINSQLLWRNLVPHPATAFYSAWKMWKAVFGKITCIKDLLEAKAQEWISKPQSRQSATPFWINPEVDLELERVHWVPLLRIGTSEASCDVLGRVTFYTIKVEIQCRAWEKGLC